MLTVIVAGRNDDYGKDFRERLFRTALHNSGLLHHAGIDFEYLLAEWNPLQDRPPLSEEFVARVPNARAVIVPPDIHKKYSLNPQMPFHEMAAKNAALRRADGDCVIVTNADILFSEALVQRIAAGNFAPDTANLPMAITYNGLYFLLTFGFTYFYTAITFDVNEVADNLKRYSSFIPGIRPGRPTADYLQAVMNRVTFVGAVFLGFITVILPIGTAKISGIPHQQMYLGGTAILIVVGVALDTMKQLQTQLVMRQYRGFIK